MGVCGLLDYLFNLILSLTKYVNIYYVTIKRWVLHNDK